MHREIEVRFLEIDTDALIARLHDLDAVDQGDVLLDEIICYDRACTWREPTGREVVRLRKGAGPWKLSYKCRHTETVDGVEEIEFEVSDVDQALLLLDRLGYPAYRTQQKRRHSFTLNGVIVDIDTWPRVPTYVELEGPDEAALREAAENLGLSWEDALIDDPRKVIETRYNIPVGSMRWFTFERFE